MSGATKLGEIQASTSGMTDSSTMETEEFYNQEAGEWSQKEDTGQLCRVCANPNEYLIPIFDGEGLEHELAMKIQKHLPIKNFLFNKCRPLPTCPCSNNKRKLINYFAITFTNPRPDKSQRNLVILYQTYPFLLWGKTDRMQHKTNSKQKNERG
ncbi:hypothetical protein L9F63_006629, partial [Diploptera punctata]